MRIPFSRPERMTMGRLGRWTVKPFACCGWLLFFFIHPADAQTVISSVEFAGNSFFSQRQLEEYLQITGSPYIGTQHIAERLQELYRSEGFYGFSAESLPLRFSDDSASVSLTFTLNESVRTLVHEVILTGAEHLPPDIATGLVETTAGEPLKSNILESDVQSILAYYSRTGYPFAEISSDSVRLHPDDPSKLIVQLLVREGAPVSLTEVSVSGNSVTKDRIIIRESRIIAGELFNQDRVENYRRRLERLQLFSSVAEPQLYIVSSSQADTLRGGLRVTVKEGNTNTFDGVLGYVPPPDPSAQGYVTGNVFVSLRNLFGTGRRALIRWQRETESTQELELQYQEPWIAGFPLNAGAALHQRKQDSTYVKTKIDVRAEYLVSDAFSVAGRLSTESVYPSSSLQQFSVFESQTIMAGGELLFDTRNDPRNPTDGVRYSTTAQQGRKSISGPAQYLTLATEKDFTINRFTVDAELYVSTFIRQVLMLGIHGRQVSSSRLELSDLFQFGGTTTLRGYRENQFFASQIAYINTEYRFLTGRASSLYGFIDAGYFSRPSDPLKGIVRQEKGLFGYGVGTRIETGLGVVNVNYALGEGDSFTNGKIHVGIINEF